jgi:hypothetical protein
MRNVGESQTSAEFVAQVAPAAKRIRRACDTICAISAQLLICAEIMLDWFNQQHSSLSVIRVSCVGNPFFKTGRHGLPGVAVAVRAMENIAVLLIIGMTHSQRVAAPRHVPAVLPAGTSSRTMSPVWKPRPDLVRMQAARQTVCVSLVKSSCARLDCERPLLPADARPDPLNTGSVQRARLRSFEPGPVEVGAPNEASTGKPVSAKASDKAHRGVLTTAASLGGALACALIRVSSAGLAARNSSIGLASLSVLQGYTPQRDCSHGSTRHASTDGCGRCSAAHR